MHRIFFHNTLFDVGVLTYGNILGIVRADQEVLMKKLPSAAELDAAMTDLKARLGEARVPNGAMAMRFRKHRTDFIAVPKDAPQHFMAVHRTRRAVIIRPYCQPELYSRLIAQLRRTLPKNSSRLVRWHRRQLAKSPSQPAWLSYVAKTNHELIGRSIADDI